MFEPISLVNVIGLTLSIIGIFTSGIKNLVNTHDRYRKYYAHFKKRRDKLKSCLFAVECWTATWFKDGERCYLDSVYEHCWGLEGYEMLQLAFGQIIKKNEEIQAMFANSDNLGSDALQRMAGTLYKNGLLKQRIKDLKTMVESLERDSARLCFDRRGESLGAQLQGKEAEIIDLSLDRVQQFSSFADKKVLPVTGNGADNTRLWHLALTPPHSTDKAQCSSCIHCFGDPNTRCLETKFLGESLLRDPERWVVQEFTVSFEFSSPDKTQGFVQVLPQRSFASRRQILDEGTPHEAEIKRFYRASSALGVVNWSLLLSRTQMMKDLTARRITYTMDHGHAASKGTGRQEMATMPVYQLLQPRNRYDHLRQSLLKDQNYSPFLLLGTTLAELCMGYPIDTQIKDHGLKLFQIERNSRKEWVEQAELMEEVSQKSDSLRYTQAVKFCFVMDARMETRREARRPVHRAEDMVECVEKILDP
jgi:hypothetical protein